MDLSLERRILKYIWLDTQSLLVWDRLMDYIQAASLKDPMAKKNCDLLRGEIEKYEQKLLDMSKGICYSDIVQVKKKYNLDTWSMFYDQLKSTNGKFGKT